VQHRLSLSFVNEILDQNKKQTLQNMGLGLYALSSLNFYSQDYFESAFLSYLDNDEKPDLNTLALLA
jgi:hypothetical protein